MEPELTGTIIHNNLEDFYTFLSRHIRSDVKENYIHLNEYPYENIIFIRRFNERSINEIRYDSTLRYSFPTIIFKNDDPGLAATLKAKGFIPLTRWKGMAIPKRLAPDEIPGLEIIEVENLYRYNQWEKVAHAVYHEFEEHPGRLPYSKLYGLKESKLFLGLYKRKPACIGFLFECNDSSGIYFIGTDPAFRGKGFGTAITKWLTVHSQKEIIVLQASVEGYKMYQKMGFAEFCNFDLYRLMPDEN